MVTERLLVNIRYSFGPRGHSNMRMDGKCVGRGIIYNFQEKQGLKYCDLPLHLSILTATFNISIVYLKVKPSTLCQHTPNNVLYNYFTVYPLFWVTLVLSTYEGVKTCIFFTPVYARSCICYVSVKTAWPLHFLVDS